jgi:tight adherence protein B
VQALSMEAKASAVIIGALPFIVAFLVYLSSPNYIMPLFTTSDRPPHPRRLGRLDV